MRMLWMISIVLPCTHICAADSVTSPIFAVRSMSTIIPCPIDMIQFGLFWVKGVNEIARYIVSTQNLDIDDSKYQYNSEDNSLTILSVESNDEDIYQCRSIATDLLFNFNVIVYGEYIDVY